MRRRAILWISLVGLLFALGQTSALPLPHYALASTANRTWKEVHELQQVLIRMASEPPVNDSVSATDAWEIAAAIHRDNRSTRLGYALYLGLLRVENPELNHWVTNAYGAVGLTQVVPRYWGGAFPECGESLADIFTQICYGSRVYLYYLNLYNGDVQQALWAYNGCSKDLRTAKAPCRLYPKRVADYGDLYTSDL